MICPVAGHDHFIDPLTTGVGSEWLLAVLAALEGAFLGGAETVAEEVDRVAEREEVPPRKRSTWPG